MIRYFGRPAGGAEEDAVVVFDHGAPIRRHPPPVLVVVLATPVEMVELKRNAKFPRGCLQHANAFRHDFFPDAVTGDNSDLVAFCHRVSCADEAGAGRHSAPAIARSAMPPRDMVAPCSASPRADVTCCTRPSPDKCRTDCGLPR